MDDYRSAVRAVARACMPDGKTFVYPTADLYDAVRECCRLANSSVHDSVDGKLAEAIRRVAETSEHKEFKVLAGWWISGTQCGEDRCRAVYAKTPREKDSDSLSDEHRVLWAAIEFAHARIGMNMASAMVDTILADLASPHLRKGK